MKEILILMVVSGRNDSTLTEPMTHRGETVWGKGLMLKQTRKPYPIGKWQ
jgi:hypothetical protein